MQSRLTTIIVAVALSCATSAAAQHLKRNPTPQDYVERNGGGASIVPAGQLVDP